MLPDPKGLHFYKYMCALKKNCAKQLSYNWIGPKIWGKKLLGENKMTYSITEGDAVFIW